ncbi:MAG: SCO family protein [Candidatus Tectomicrobia bacterium]|nr:SCO family protein [Candidatus Tectomicrobia bacterium]
MAITKWRWSRKGVARLAGVLAFFAVGLAGGAILSQRLVFGTNGGPVPKLSEVAASPEQIDQLNPSSLPPIGISPVPPRAQEGRSPQVSADPAPTSAANLHADGGHAQPADPGGAKVDNLTTIPWADPYPASPFSLTDQDGRLVALNSLQGRVVVLSFLYTHCKTVCPLLARQLTQLQHDLGPLMRRDILFLSVTIDPKRDTPEVLKRYGETLGIDFRSWRLLTGPEERVQEVLRAYRVHVEVEKEPHGPQQGEGYELAHGAPIYFIDQWGRVRKRTAPTMLPRLGQPALEWLVKQGASDTTNGKGGRH